MAIKFYSSTLTHHCPKCKTVLKKEKHDSFLLFIYVFLFIPIGLIALIVHFIKKKTQKEEFNKYGEQIICCPTCQSLVAIYSNGGIAGSSRIIIQEKELLKIMEPIISYLHSNYNIAYDKYNIEEKYSEVLGLCFKNNNVKCNVFILNACGKLKMKIANEDCVPFDMEQLTIKIIDTLF